jgi:hypothetical protein
LRRWLRHYATSSKAAGSIPDEVIRFFNCPNPSSRTIALGSTLPLTEMSTRNLPRGKEPPARKADNLTAICEPMSRENVGASTSYNRMGLHMDNFTFLFRHHYAAESCSSIAHLSSSDKRMWHTVHKKCFFHVVCCACYMTRLQERK